MLSKRKAMRLPAIPSGLILAPALMLTLASCSRYDNSPLDVAVVESTGQGKDDRATAAMLLRASTVEGLVAFDDAGRVIPALADRWIVTDDGQSYIFRLRDGHWANGDPITADTARRAFNAAREALADSRSPERQALAADLEGIDEVRAMAGRVIEVRLARPMPYLLQLLAQPELGLIHRGRGTGSMTVVRAGGVATLSAIDPAQLGLPPIENWDRRTRPVRMRELPGSRAVAAFNDGSVDLVLGGRLQDFALTRSVGILRGTIQIDPVVGLFGLRVMRSDGFLGDPANREALAMAVDREGLMAPFGVGGWQATTRVVTPSLDGDLGTIGERWAGQTLEQRRAVGVARVRAWQGRPDAGGPVRLSLWLPEGGGSTVLFNRLAADFAAIGIALDRAEGKPEAGKSGADLVLVDDVAGYPRAGWYLNRLSCSGRNGLCSPEADAHVAAAAIAPTPAERAALLTQAETELTTANVFIPFGTPIRWSLVRGSVSGFSPNAWGWHPLMPLAWLPK